MKKILSIIIAAFLVCSLLIVGCSSQEMSNKQQESTEIIIGESTDFTSGFNLISGDDGSGFVKYMPNVYETLVLYDESGMKPGLAESWNINENEIIFKLREGVKFSDGSELTSDVVKLNFDAMKKAIGEQFSWFAGISKLKEVKVMDKYQVKFIYDTPYIAALQDLTVNCPMGIMSPKAYENGNASEELNNKTFGTGPYKIDKFEKGKYYTFVRNENYWGERPKLDKITVKIIPNMESRVLALKTGEIDIMYGIKDISQDSFVFLGDEGFGTKVAEKRFSTRNILLNSSKEPFSNLDVRLAAQYAVNKDAICKSTLCGLEERADNLLNPNLPFCDVDVDPYYYNTAKAEELLDKAGWLKVEGKDIREKDGKKLEAEILYRSGWGMEEDICEAAASQLREVGFDVKISGLEIMTWYSKVLEGNFEATINDTYGIQYDPHTYLSPMLNYSADNLAQQGLLQKSEIDRRIRESFSTIDEKVIQENYEYILKTLHKEALNIYISYTKDTIIYNKNKIKDYEFENQTKDFYINSIIIN